MQTAMPPAIRRFASKRLSLSYAEWGPADAPPLLLIHGGRDHCRSWDWTAAALSGRYRIIAPDLRGHGDSDWAIDGNYASHDFVYDLAQLVFTLGDRPVPIVAHSLGGNIAIRYAGLYPDTVTKLVAIEGLGFSPALQAERNKIGNAERLRQWIAETRASEGWTPKRYATFEDALARMREENAHLSEAQARHLTLHGLKRLEDGAFQWKFDPMIRIWPPLDLPPADIEALWSAISCPTLLVYGADSWASNPLKDGRAAHFKHARVSLIEKAGHWVHHDQFDRFMAEISDFLDA
jgi:pimeloyl-ACP methyl ester carboxylesterase